MMSRNPIPATVYEVFSRRWIPVMDAPRDAEHWHEQGYLMIVKQGKEDGYAVALRGYRLIVDVLG